MSKIRMNKKWDVIAVRASTTSFESVSLKFERETSVYFLMAVLTPKKFHGIIVILQSFLVNAYSKGNREFCESIFETQTGKHDLKHVISNFASVLLFFTLGQFFLVAF